MNTSLDLGLPAGITFAVMTAMFTIGAKFGMVVTKEQLDVREERIKREMAEKYVTHDDLTQLRETIDSRMARVETQLDKILEAVTKKP